MTEVRNKKSDKAQTPDLAAVLRDIVLNRKAAQGIKLEKDMGRRKGKLQTSIRRPPENE